MRFAIAIAIPALVAAPVLAQDMTTMDTDGDGMLSMEEMQATMPDMTEDTFTQVDTNADGMIDQAEYDAGVEAGTITTEG